MTLNGQSDFSFIAQVGYIYSCFFAASFTVAVAMEDSQRAPQSGPIRWDIIIEVKAQLPGIYGNVNQPCPWAAPSDSVYCHKSLATVL